MAEFNEEQSPYVDQRPSFRGRAQDAMSGTKEAALLNPGRVAFGVAIILLIVLVILLINGAGCIFPVILTGLILAAFSYSYSVSDYRNSDLNKPSDYGF